MPTFLANEVGRVQARTEGVILTALDVRSRNGTNTARPELIGVGFGDDRLPFDFCSAEQGAGRLSKINKGNLVLG